MTASVIAVTTSRVVQLKRRPIHHSIAQHIKTGTMMLSCNGSIRANEPALYNPYRMNRTPIEFPRRQTT